MKRVEKVTIIKFTYRFVDDEGPFEGVVYCEGRIDEDAAADHVEKYLDKTDKAKVLKEVTEVLYMGNRLLMEVPRYR